MERREFCKSIETTVQGPSFSDSCHSQRSKVADIGSWIYIFRIKSASLELTEEKYHHKEKSYSHEPLEYMSFLFKKQDSSNAPGTDM